MIQSFIEAPTWKAVVIIIGILAICILMITKYFVDENKRRRDAYLEAKKIKEQQNKIAEKLQYDASLALRQNMDTMFEQDFEDFTIYIEEKRYSNVLMNIPRKYHHELGVFIYNEELNAEDRAARIISILKDISNGL